MKISKTTTYKIIKKSSWGIWIQITAHTSSVNSSDIQVSKNIWLKNQINNIKLSDIEIDYIMNGLKWISLKIEEKINHPISIVLEHIQIIICDFQIEGLFYAIAFWASEYFEFKLPDYRYEFNKVQNKYEFPDL